MTTQSVDNAVEDTYGLFKNVFAIDFEAIGWNDPGWDTPAYRLKDPRFKSFDGFRLSDQSKAKIRAAHAALSADIKDQNLYWIGQRLVRRYPLENDAALLGMVSYMILWDAWGKSDEPFQTVPAIVDWAFFEHVLWTAQYRDDSVCLYGKLLERPDYQWDREPTDHAAQDRVREILSYGGLGSFVGDIERAGWVSA